MTDELTQDRPGISFEKVVAALQAKIDPSAKVAHNVVLIDRLQQPRQFDIVITGTFAGQQLVGVIECKDLNRRVGTPEVDAFVTKASDINANFKIIMSRRGFTKPALAKCRHYGIQPLSLLDGDPANKTVSILHRWTADMRHWGKLSIAFHPIKGESVNFTGTADDAKIDGKPILAWFINHLVDLEINGPYTEPYSIGLTFDHPQTITDGANVQHECSAISFFAENNVLKLEIRKSIFGDGFFNWNSNEATFPAGTTLVGDSIPMDFSLWSPRDDTTWKVPGPFEIHLIGRTNVFTKIEDAIDLDPL